MSVKNKDLLNIHTRTVIVELITHNFLFSLRDSWRALLEKSFFFYCVVGHD